MGINDWIRSVGLLELNEWTILLRIVMATLLGGLLGLERTKKRRAAGIRTYTLVCLGATIVMLTGQFMLTEYGNTDPARIGAQVISGIGFLGAGTILITGVQQIKGLTTAACLWASACMGIAIGIGFYFGAMLMFLAIVFVMTLLNFVQAKYVKSSQNLHLYIIFETLKNVKDFITLLKSMDIAIDEFEIEPSSHGIGVGAHFGLHIKGKGRTQDDVMRMVNECSGLTMVVEM